jgi:hypothetical protein
MSERHKTGTFHALPDDNTIELTYRHFTHTERSAFFIWDLLEKQRSKVDPKKEPDIYETLNSVADEMYEIWVSIKALERDYGHIEPLMFLEREG